MDFKSLSKKAKYYWVITSVILALVITSIALVIVFSVDKELIFTLALSVGVPCFLLSAFIVIYAFLKYHFYKYAYCEEKIVICYGVIFKHTIVIPVCQIQDLHVYEGPIMMMLKLKGVILSTAGSNFEIKCLEKEVAQKLVDDIQVFLKERLEVLSNEKI